MLSSKNSKKTIPWKLLTIEALLIVMSVLLALGLNSWREARANDQLAHRALQSVVDEAGLNCSLVKHFHPYHQSVADGETDPSGLQIGLLLNDAWDSAKSTGAAAHLEYSIAETIGSIHAEQSDHRTYVQSYIQAILTNLSGGFIELSDIHQTDGEMGVVLEITRIQERLIVLYNRLNTLVGDHYGDNIDLSGFCGE